MKGTSGIYRFTGIAAALLAMMVASCSKQQLQTTYDSQDKRIDSFIQSQLSSSKAIRTYPNGGSNRLVIVEGEGEDSLSTSGTVSFHYAAYTFSGSISNNNLFATRPTDGTVRGEKGTGMLHHIFRKVRIRVQTHWHNSCKLRPALPYLGGKY